MLRKKIEAHFDLLVENKKIPFFIINELILNEERRNVLVRKIYSNNLNIYRRFDELLQAEIKKGNVREISTINLLLNVISMNIIVFITLPMIESQFDYSDAEIDAILQQRKSEVVTAIINSLRPENK